MKTTSLEGKVAIVTGGGRGLGQAMTLGLPRRRHRYRHDPGGRTRHRAPPVAAAGRDGRAAALAGFGGRSQRHRRPPERGALGQCAAGGTRCRRRARERGLAKPARALGQPSCALTDDRAGPGQRAQGIPGPSQGQKLRQTARQADPITAPRVVSPTKRAAEAVRDAGRGRWPIEAVTASATAVQAPLTTLIPPSPTWPGSSACRRRCRAPARCDTPAAAGRPRAGSATAGRSARAGGSRAGHRPT
jgi:hypothetical protein